MSIITEEYMRLKANIVVIIGLIFFLQGCSTIKNASKGAVIGAKEDWAALGKADGWIKENLW